MHCRILNSTHVSQGGCPTIIFIYNPTITYYFFPIQSENISTKKIYLMNKYDHCRTN